MIDNIQFRDTDNKVTVTIDNQSLESSDIKEIIRLPTSIIGRADAILYAPIDINMMLVVPTDEEDSTQYQQVVEKGFVNISITNINQSITYDEKKHSFRDGIIQTTMTDKLGVGEYILNITYAGNNYYEPTTLSYQFNVGKRKVECQFHTNVNGGYPGKTIEVPLTLFDALNGKTINNCTVNYTFNDVGYITRTNGSGYANLTLTMPNVDEDHCASNIITNDEEVINEYIDDDEVDIYWTIDGTLVPYPTDTTTQFTYDDEYDETVPEEEPILSIVDEEDMEEDDEIDQEDTKYNVYVYELTIGIDNNNYEMDEQIIYLSVSKIDTQITAYFTKDDVAEKIIIEGDVFSNQNYMTDNVKYGIVELYIPDVNYTKKINIGDYGHFMFEVQYEDINTVVSGNVQPYVAQSYSPEHYTKTTMYKGDGEKITDTLVFNRSYQPKKSADFLAIVEDQITRERINESMVTFVIKEDDDEVYRYVTEVNEIGEAYMSFDVSTIGHFTVQAFYHPMFNLLGSESQIIQYEVREE